MNPCTSLSPAVAARLAQIVRALNELNRCVEERGKYKDDLGTAWGLTIGECDWREELERLLYEN